jgi:hypothetical protein
MCDGPRAVDLPSIDEVLAESSRFLLVENGASLRLASRPGGCGARLGNPGTTVGAEM